MTEQTSTSALLSALDAVVAAWDNPDRLRAMTAAMAAARRTATTAHAVLDGLDDVIVTESAGSDGALLVIIDTDGAPDGSDGTRGLRVMVNDGPVYEGVPFDGMPAETPRNLVQLTTADAEKVLGRPMTTTEERAMVKSLPHSMIPEDFTALLRAIASGD